MILYERQRCPDNRKLGTAICTTVTPIRIERKRVHLAGDWLSKPAIKELAIADGFDCAEDFFNYFKSSFEGVLIQWGMLRPHDPIPPEKRLAWAQSLNVGSLVYVGGFPLQHNGLNVICEQKRGVFRVMSNPKGKTINLWFAISLRRGICCVEQAGRRGLWLGNPDWHKGDIHRRAGIAEVMVLG